jgi:hypothetical protein
MGGEKSGDGGQNSLNFWEYGRRNKIKVIGNKKQKDKSCIK